MICVVRSGHAAGPLRAEERRGETLSSHQDRAHGWRWGWGASRAVPAPGEGNGELHRGLSTCSQHFSIHFYPAGKSTGFYLFQEGFLCLGQSRAVHGVLSSCCSEPLPRYTQRCRAGALLAPAGLPNLPCPPSLRQRRVKLISAYLLTICMLQRRGGGRNVAIETLIELPLS